jgi:hypothetical protein
MSTMNEKSIRHEGYGEIEEEDETDGWGPVRVRRSSVPIAMPDVRETRKAAEPERDSAGNIIEPGSRDRSRTLR